MALVEVGRWTLTDVVGCPGPDAAALAARVLTRLP
jgi:hypothetical protein